MHTFLWGALVMGCAVVGLFFLRFWRTTSDRLFLFFSLAFAMLAGSWGWLATAGPEIETRHFAYMLRLAAFVLIIVAIVDKNRRARATPRASRRPAMTE
jgi:hypothetical protein